jgi:lysozyme
LQLQPALLAFILVAALGKRNVKVSDKLIKLLRHHEGVRNKPYKCPAGLFTVGVGHLIGDGKTLPPEWNRTFTNEEINGILKHDLNRFELGVHKMLPNVPLRQHEFDAIVSFCFNLGLGCFQRSTIRQALLRGDKEAAMESLVKYCRAGGKVLKGLQNRRLDERRLFEGL